ncbi:MAG TPA: hypothetical protein VFA22_00305, partial [Stellaceae bacterium]|nr:hypothetical protein [Stellaceae bacterium]
AFEDKQGHDLGEQALAAVFGSDEHATKIAAAAPTPLVPSPSAPQPAAVTAAAPRPAPRPQPQSPQSPPQSKPARAADALPLVVPDHPPMPLYRGAAPRPAASEPAQDPVQALKMHNAVLERQIGTPPQSKPVPLIPPAGALPADRLVAPAVPAGAPTGPVDISQKMLDALDKYMKLEKERKGAAVAPGVDLAL